MIINGINPGAPLPEKRPEEKKEELKPVNREEIVKEIKKQEEQKEAKKENVDYEKLAIDEYSLKELLFLLTSRGNSETIEKLAAILKREKEEINSRKKS